MADQVQVAAITDRHTRRAGTAGCLGCLLGIVGGVRMTVALALGLVNILGGALNINQAIDVLWKVSGGIGAVGMVVFLLAAFVMRLPFAEEDGYD